MATLVVALVTGAVIGLAPSAQAKRHVRARRATDPATIHACYNVRTRSEKTHGNLRILRPGQHCPPGTQEVSWNDTGPEGAHGAAGAAGHAGATGAIGPVGPTGAAGTAASLVVKDAKGDTVGTLVGAVPAFLYILESDGTIELVDSVNGDFEFFEANRVRYTSSNCTGPAYVERQGGELEEILSQQPFTLRHDPGDPLWKLGPEVAGPLVIHSERHEAPANPQDCEPGETTTPFEHLFLAIPHGTVPATGLDGPLTVVVAP
jgi:hypothetical protein